MTKIYTDGDQGVYEWPRYRSGEHIAPNDHVKVHCADARQHYDGKEGTVRAVSFYRFATWIVVQFSISERDWLRFSADELEYLPCD